MAVELAIAPKQTFKGNLALFAACVCGYLAWKLLPFAYGTPWLWLIVAVLAVGGVKRAFEGVNALRDNYRLRQAWAAARRPSKAKRDDRFATFEEMKAAGMFDGVGRLLGTDLEGRPLFEPHRLNPTFSYVLAPQGAGKTSTQVIASAVLSALPQRERRQP